MDSTKQLQILNVIAESPKEQRNRNSFVGSPLPSAAVPSVVNSFPAQPQVDGLDQLNHRNIQQQQRPTTNDLVSHKTIEDTAYNSFLNLFDPSIKAGSAAPGTSSYIAHNNVNSHAFVTTKRQSDLYSSHRGSTTSGGLVSNLDSDYTSTASDSNNMKNNNTNSYYGASGLYSNGTFAPGPSYHSNSHYLHYLDDEYTLGESSDHAEEDVEYPNRGLVKNPQYAQLPRQQASAEHRASALSVVAGDVQSETIKSTANMSLNTFETDLQHRSMINLDFYDLTAEDYNGVPFNFSLLFDKVVLIINVASKCFMTKQYKELEELYEKYNSKGFEIIAFPSNQFFQEPKDEQQIVNFCSLKYSVTFPIMKKIRVNGEKASPIYSYLKNQKKGTLHNKRILWNFEKFIIDKRGNVVCRESCYKKPKHVEELIIKLLDE